MYFLPTTTNTLVLGTATLLFTATTVNTSPLPPHNNQNNGPLVPFCNGPLGIPLICPPSVPEIYLTPGIVIPDGANGGIEHGGEVSKEKIEPRSDENHGIEQHGGKEAHEVPSLHHGPVVFPNRAHGDKETTVVLPSSYNDGVEHDGEVSEKGHQVAPKEKIEPRSEVNHGIEQHGGEETIEVLDVHRVPVVFLDRANNSKEYYGVVVTHEGADGGKENTIVIPESYNDGIEHGGVYSKKTGVQVPPKDKIEPRSDNIDNIEHDGEEVLEILEVSEAPKQEIEPRSASPDFGAARYVSVAEDHWGKWQGNDAWFATPRLPKDKKVGP